VAVTVFVSCNQLWAEISVLNTIPLSPVGISEDASFPNIGFLAFL
jgi:hypothetical protein